MRAEFNSYYYNIMIIIQTLLKQNKDTLSRDHYPADDDNTAYARWLPYYL